MAGSFFNHFGLCLESESVCESGAHYFDGVLTSEPQGTYDSASPVLGLEMHYDIGVYYFDLEARDLNSGPHSSMENISPTETSLQPFFFLPHLKIEN